MEKRSGLYLGDRSATGHHLGSQYLVPGTLHQPAYEAPRAKEGNLLEVGYGWKYKGRWNGLEAAADAGALALEEGSKAEFITEHFWGYTKARWDRTGEYEVEHPRWDLYPVKGYRIDCDFGGLYGKAFEGLRTEEPRSVFLAEGSKIKVYGRRGVGV